MILNKNENQIIFSEGLLLSNWLVGAREECLIDIIVTDGTKQKNLLTIPVNSLEFPGGIPIPDFYMNAGSSIVLVRIPECEFLMRATLKLGKLGQFKSRCSMDDGIAQKYFKVDSVLDVKKYTLII